MEGYFEDGDEGGGNGPFHRGRSGRSALSFRRRGDRLPGRPLYPCGVILSDASLLERLPVQPTPGGYPMVQADKEDVDSLGVRAVAADRISHLCSSAPVNRRIISATGVVLSLVRVTAGAMA
ncbi:hypothetical protein FNV62_52770 [Streptomyces sp. RLB3-17]|nr:hypothetical protein FNV67_53855 [Streptomyces sp. S1D4-20]QDN72946.1 hypothetical protein FNV66_52730 [Streptomyces sp. S1D4-14]QDO03650.1 hypothetical protein FNV58_54390 [Streptomyces sp. RLB1-9]QDO25380.1 hypothetical protein FNV65_52965 [Streptomyces sp. S1A1-8]QDO35502.1 hypothetical protein FNV63_52990 [Streptomyces sp. S1A1-3]QDO45519.1 hypothetical protein FNV62_52770 [Streptomyces sp. RLB3-17]QDO55469.1 hypothetical protein FNV60_51590 [Streptomyces sp. RLB3-5]QDO65646.1 hypothe